MATDMEPNPASASPSDLSPALARGLITRRTALIGLGLGAASVVTGCASRQQRSAAAAATPSGLTKSAIENVVNWSNWPDYIDVGSDGLSHPTLEAFTRQTGITVHYTEDYIDNETFYQEVQPQLAAGQDTGRDTWCATDYMVARLIRSGYVQSLDKSVMPNVSRLVSSLQNVQFDPGRNYSIPWQSGFTGIGYNPSLSGGRVETVNQLLTDPALKGRVTLLSDMQDTVGLVMLDMGIDPSSFADADFNRAMKRLYAVKASGQIKGFTGNEYVTLLASGQIAACLAYTGDIVQLQATTPNLGYALPKAGFVLWSDNFVIPNNAKHKENTERLIDYYYQPDVMAKVEEYVNYISPVDGSRQALLSSDPATARNILIFPSSELLKRAHVFRGLTQDEDQRYNQAFQQLINS